MNFPGSGRPGDPDTTLGGGPGFFPTTAWSRIVDLKSMDEAEKQLSLEKLAESYWRPVYTFIRSRWSKSNEDAKDLTQDFFAWMLESDFVRRADPDRGRFRAFVKGSLDHFLNDARRRDLRQKRGGGKKILSLDAAETPPPLPGFTGPPEDLLDEAWRSELLVRARRDLESEYRKEGKEIQFRVFEEYYLSGDADADYRKVAEKHGIGVGAVSHYLLEGKTRYRQTLRNLVAETVTGEDALREELRSLFGDEP